VSEYKNLAGALVRAQAEIEGAVKGSVNPAFRSKYADLASVIDAVRPALAKHGLAFIQEVTERDQGVYVETVVVHESGEMYRCGKLPIPAPKQDPHGYGSAISYGKRYSLMAAFGVPSADDDGNAAVASRPAQKPPVAINDTEGTMVLDSLREAAKGGLDALQERFKKIPNSATKAAVWEKHQGELKKTASDVSMFGGDPLASFPVLKKVPA
jgi:hypothetical protein